MSEASDTGEKTHEPTPKKLLDARKKGQIPKSTDLSASAAYLGLILALTILGPTSILGASSKLSRFIADPTAFVSQEGAIELASISRVIGSVSVATLIPFFAVPALAVLLSLISQQAITFAPSKLAPKLSKISPITSVKNKFGSSGLFEFAKSVVKLVIVGLVMFWFIRSSLPEMLQIIGLEPRQLTASLGNNILSFLTIILVISVAIGGIDYLWQLAEHLRKNKMSRKEVEDESKEAEGDPHNKQARRQRGYEIAMNQMLADVPEAAVVIVNPTHYAVALKWDPLSASAPICVAKGTDEIAMRIRETAAEFSVPIHRDPPTARSLFARIDVGQEIWPDDYKAVAAAIRFAQSINSKAKQI
ncbi:flagellar type III secretion system protein FlhB [uncultured Litoreibacter sp.]|uniref:EscU/YscU/HrcU family type III secretion system export apparatus switch protein n=1 Tax=uncultured Litoreibacter sp. TaxID=1392394 RepID=UPI00260BF550|nr:flagellar type III secretion system protein FlhB [uncultured Litoreibacter sp.]